jgi:hypothetical protein
VTSCFLCARLTEAAKKAEEDAVAARDELARVQAELDRVKERKVRRAELKKHKLLEALRAIHCPPALPVKAYVPPAVRRPVPRDRFALVEVE